jgi:hypothetical protein
MDPNFLDLGTSQIHAPAALPPEKEPAVPISEEAGWTAEKKIYI